MPDEDDVDESYLTEQTIAERACGRAAIAKYTKRHEMALAHRAAEQGNGAADEATLAAQQAKRLDRNAPPVPAATVFPLAPEPYDPSASVAGAVAKKK